MVVIGIISGEGRVVLIDSRLDGVFFFFFLSLISSLKKCSVICFKKVLSFIVGFIFKSFLILFSGFL